MKHEPLPNGWAFNEVRKAKDEEGIWEIGFKNHEDGWFAPILTVNTGFYYQDNAAEPLARAILARLSA